MFKPARLLLTIFILFAAVPTLAFASAGANKAALDTSALTKGTIGIRLASKPTVDMKAKISKNGTSYTYTLNTSADGQIVWLPLQMGNGQYEVMVLERVTGNKYRVNLTEKISVTVKNTPDVFLNSTLSIAWENAGKTLAKTKQLTKSAATDEQKAKAIYEYIVRNVSYDKDLARKITSDYVPDIDGTLASGKAICYGYATLYAAMLRSEGIPAKLVMGKSNLVDEYHAWNEVYLNGKWVVVDTTVDAGLSKGDKKAAFAKKASDYAAAKYY
ncbi:transglutaminase domain-containing protein [Cohnella cellulosilytica]|uniref:Transglutaminase domain-containing protein n=1 Tax=Cohnella cellulosilytica TaxID=986710 RepID=A0ABW2F2R5_9BACL